VHTKLSYARQDRHARTLIRTMSHRAGAINRNECCLLVDPARDPSLVSFRLVQVPELDVPLIVEPHTAVYEALSSRSHDAESRLRLSKESIEHVTGLQTTLAAQTTIVFDVSSFVVVLSHLCILAQELTE